MDQSKFHVLFPLCHKTGAEVALNLQSRVFSYIGTPKILHSDNGREFVNQIVSTVVKEWPGEVTIVIGRPRNPKCQGLIEQGNGMVERLLGIRLLEAIKDDSRLDTVSNGDDLAPLYSVLVYMQNCTCPLMNCSIAQTQPFTVL